MTSREIRLSALERRYVKAARIHRELTRMEHRILRKRAITAAQHARELQGVSYWQTEFDKLVQEMK